MFIFVAGHDMASSSKVGHVMLCVVLAQFLIGCVTCDEEGVWHLVYCGLFCAEYIVGFVEPHTWE